MNYRIIIIFGSLFLFAGCNHQSQRPSTGSFKVFGTLRSPKNLYDSPPTALPVYTPAPTGLVPAQADPLPQYNPPPSIPIPNPSPALNVIPNGTISQKIKTPQNFGSIKLLPPETATHETLKPTEEKPPESKEPPISKNEGVSKNLIGKNQPLDIPGYSLINNSIAIGLLPYPDGIDWLVKEKFKSALFIHSSTQETKAITSLFEKRGMKLNLLQLEESNISAERFNIEISKLQNSTQQPIYVFDLDGSIAASFWFVYFQKTTLKSEDETLSTLLKLGMNPNKSEQSKSIFKAAKKLVW
ncbi:MAG: hypothetical protein EBT92_07840 [Planctomycetes bacterium]|nr:hypothetical protein [Planctomycetota bacterium]